jgi:hypothetical protein
MFLKYIFESKIAPYLKYIREDLSVQYECFNIIFSRSSIFQLGAF